MPMRPLMPREFPDRAVRDALVWPDNLHDLLRRTHPHLADRLDYSRLETVSRTYVLDDWRQRELDVLVRLPLLGGEGGEVLVCVLVEHLTNPDPVMPLRLLLDAVLFWEQQWRQWEQGHDFGVPLRLTPVLPVVLVTGLQPWNTNRSLADLFDGPDELRVYAPQWPMQLAELVARTPAELLASGQPFWQALAVARAERAEAGEFRAVFLEALERLAPLAQANRVGWERLLQVLLGWGLLRRGRREHAGLIEAVQQSRLDALLQQEVIHMIENVEMTWEQELLSTGEARGRAEGEARGRAEGEARGRAEGEARGRAEGALQTLRDVVRRLLRQHFGELPPEVLARIEQAERPALEAAVERINSMGTLADLQL
jgi:hypothetical protein